MFKHFKPINEYILIELCPIEKTTSGGIIIPTEAQEKTQQGIVLHAGSSEQVLIGDKVFFKKYMGTSLDDKHLVLSEKDILGVL